MTTGEIIAAHRAARGPLIRGEDRRGPSTATPEQLELLRAHSPEGQGFLLRVVAPEDQGVVFESGCWMHGGAGTWATPRTCGCPVLDFPVDEPKSAQPEVTTIALGPVKHEED